MSFRQGTRIIAGNGSVPYINNRTCNWEYAGQDSGIQAIPIKMTIKQYETAKNNGTIEEGKMYFITDDNAILFKTVILQQSGWTADNGRFTYTITNNKFLANDTVFMDLSSSLSDDDYIKQYEEIKNSNIIRVTVSDGNLRLLAIDKPTMNLTIDISVIRCLIG